MQFGNAHHIMNQLDLDDQILANDDLIQSGVNKMKTRSSSNNDLASSTAINKQTNSGMRVLQKSASGNTTGSSQTQIKIEDFIKQISASQSQAQMQTTNNNTTSTPQP